MMPFPTRSSGTGDDPHRSWIRRLLRPSPPSFAPIQPTQVNPSPVMAPTAWNPPYGTGSGDGAHESRTSTSLLTRKILFSRRIRNIRKERHPSRIDRETCVGEGFGPFQIRTRRGLVDPAVGSSPAAHSSSWGRLQGGLDLGFHGDAVGRDGIQDLGHGGHTGTVGFGERSRNSNGDVGFPTLQCQRMRLIGEEEERENNFPIQDNRFPSNHRTRFTGEKFFRSESNFINNANCAGRSEGAISVLDRRVADDRHCIPVSPFYRYWSASKKNGYPTENRTNGLTRPTRNDSCIRKHPWFVGGESRFPSSSRASVAGDQRLYEQRLSACQWPMTQAFHDINFISRKGGITHCSSSDGAASRLSLECHHMHHNVVLEHERPTLAGPSETEEPYSFWNMSRFKRPEMASSFQASGSDSRKRKCNADKSVSWKSRKLGPED